MSGLGPQNFDQYVPWACNQFEIETDIFIICDTEGSHIGKRIGVTPKKTAVVENRIQHYKTLSEQDHNEINNVPENVICHREDSVVINTTYDSIGNLIMLKILRNKRIPTTLLKVVRIILNYHVHLDNITIDRGLNNESLYEVCKLLELSNITEICLDNTNIPNGCYYILLEKKTHLKYLSLRQCNIDEDIIEIIASKLAHPLPASKTLTTLNLASNKIRDVGAKYLAEALKCNKQLAYLNISDNYIKDEGAEAILDVLKEFRMTPEELYILRTMHLKNCTEKFDSQMIEVEEKSVSMLKLKGKKKTSVMQTKKKPAERETQAGIAELNYFDVKDPLSPKNIFTKDGNVFSLGNNYLAYLNLAHNNLSYWSVKKVLDVMLYQQTAARTPRGLLSVCLEGNYIPNECIELKQIDQILNDIATDAVKHVIDKKKNHLDHRTSSIFRK